uniref:Uncharacterized protein n=1 Tax=Ditylenchus dipsaci TaxID=166011 RepID=A0A915EGN8_9BILA
MRVNRGDTSSYPPAPPPSPCQAPLPAAHVKEESIDWRMVDDLGRQWEWKCSYMSSFLASFLSCFFFSLLFLFCVVEQREKLLLASTTRRLRRVEKLG